jgi:hypothetical protein
MNWELQIILRSRLRGGVVSQYILRYPLRYVGIWLVFGGVPADKKLSECTCLLVLLSSNSQFVTTVYLVCHLDCLYIYLVVIFVNKHNMLNFVYLRWLFCRILSNVKGKNEMQEY